MSSGQIVSWRADGGIESKKAPLMVQPGSALLLDDVRQERLNEWRTRPGTNHNVLDDLPSANVPVLCTESPWNGFVGLCRQTNATTGARIYSPSAGTRWITPPFSGSSPTCSQLGPSAWTRTPVAPLTTGNSQPSLFSTAQGGSYRLSAWWTRVVANSGIQVTLQTIDGAMVQYFAKFNSDNGANRPRVVYSSAANRLVLIYIDGTNHVVVNVWDAATGTQVVSGNAIAANAFATPPSAYLDAIYYGGSTITIAYRNTTGTGNLEIAEYDPTLNTFTLYPQAQDASGCISLFPDPDLSGIRMVGISTVTPEVRVVRLNSVGVIQTNQLVEAVDAFNLTGVAYNAGADWMIIYGQNPIKAVKRRSGVNSAVATIVPTRTGLYAIPATGAWREPGTDSMRYILLVNGSAADDPQPTYHEMALEFENASATIGNQWTEPQARILPLNAGGPFGDRGCLGQVQRLGTDNYLAALCRITQFNVASDGQGGDQFAIDSWTCQYLNSTTYTNQNVGHGTQTQQSAFLPAGSLLQTATGQLLCAHGASANPFKPALTPSAGAGSLNPTKHYTYGVTVSMPDEQGNEWRSPMSVLVTILPGGANNTVTIAGSLTPLENQLRRRVVMFWRTDGDATTPKLLHIIDDTVANTGTYNYVDTTGDIGAGQEYQFQIPGTSSGELEATLTPRLLHPTNWNGRLWGIDADFPNKVRFSKPLSTGLLPEFPEEFVVEVDDVYGPGTGLAAMDDKIVLFKGVAAYVAGGDGPANDGSGAPYTFNLISSENGSILGSPSLSTGGEIYTVTQGGLFRLRRSQEFDFVGAAIDRFLSMPLLTSSETVIGMVLSPMENEVRIQTTNYRFVHDRIFDCWERDTGGMGSGVAFTRMLNGKQALFMTNGQMWIEASDSNTPADAGVNFAGKIRGPWMRPANMEGWLNLLHLRALGECTTAGSVAQSQISIFFDNDDSIVETFQPRIQIAAAVGPFRANCTPRRSLCTAFSPQLTLPAGDATIRFDSWAALVAPEPQMQGITGADNWLANATTAAKPCPDCPTFPASSPLPTPTRSTVPTIYDSIQAGSNLGGHNSADLFVKVKNGMIASGVWTCAYSCDGNTAGSTNDGIDRITDYTKWIGTGGGGAGDSFIVLTNTKTSEQIIFRCTVSNTAWTEINFWFCPLGGVTGGTVGAPPTAPTMITPSAQIAQWMGTGPAAPPDDNPLFHAALWVASDGAYTRMAWSYKGKLLSFWQFDTIQNGPTPWTTPRMYSFMVTGNDYTAPNTRYIISTMGKAQGAAGFSKQSIIPGPTTIQWDAGIAEAQQAGATNYANRVVAVATDWPGITAKYPWYDPLGLMRSGGAAGTNGFGGHLVDQWWTVPVFNDFDTAGSMAFVMIGDQLLQWNGQAGSVMGGASVDYPIAQWYGRSTA